MAFLNSYICTYKSLGIKDLEQIKAYLEQIATISNIDWDFFTSKLQRRVIQKKAIFLKLNHTENHISFIESGVVRLYIPKENPEKEITFGFSFKNQFISAYDSFLTQEPSAYQLQALTETTLLSITYSDLQEVYKRTQIGNFIGRLTAERLFLIKSKREQNLLSLNAKERYIRLFKERPELLKVIPLKYISSYIGVTAQALSRIRRRILVT
jgi:CRP-like cAMP-binding protein